VVKNLEMRGVVYIQYFEALNRMSRGTLVGLLVCMPYAYLSPAARPPSQLAPYMHLAAMAVLSLLACVSFKTARRRTCAVFFIFIFSALMELLQYFSPHRNSSWEDVGINALGCLAGGMLFGALNVLRFKC